VVSDPHFTALCTLRGWHHYAGGKANFVRDLLALKYPEASLRRSILLLSLFRCLEEDRHPLPHSLAEESGQTLGEMVGALLFWRENGVLTWEDAPDGLRTFTLLKSPLPVCFRLVEPVSSGREGGVGSGKDQAE
jgi:hypothetical protein